MLDGAPGAALDLTSLMRFYTRTHTEHTRSRKPEAGVACLPHKMMREDLQNIYYFTAFCLSL